MDTGIIPNVYSLMGSFLVVIVLLLGALLFLRKIYGFKPNKKLNDRHINIIEILPLNQRQKIILCNVNDQEILLAVSGQSITALAHWVSKNFKSNSEMNRLRTLKVLRKKFQKENQKENLKEKGRKKKGKMNKHQARRGKMNKHRAAGSAKEN